MSVGFVCPMLPHDMLSHELVSAGVGSLGP